METIILVIQLGILLISSISLVIGLLMISDPSRERAEFTLGMIFNFLSVIILSISSFLFDGILLNISVIITFALLSVIIIQGIVFVPNNPISEAVITKYGKIDWIREKETVIKKHGYRFLFLKGIIYDYILIPVQKVNKNLGKQKVITPDNVANFVPVEYTYTPGPKHYAYIKAGKEKVEDILDDQIQEKLRIWASSEKEGPKTFLDMRGAGDEAISVLIKLIAGDNLEPMGSDIPTWQLFQYFGKVPHYPSEHKIIEKRKKEIMDKLNSLPEKERSSLKERVDKRWEIIMKLRQGNGTQEINSLGITLNRFNIGEIEVDPDMEKAIKNKAIESAQAESEKVELDNVKKRIFELMFEVDKNGRPKKDKDGKFIRTGISEQQAIELIQSERGKVPKDIKVTRQEFSLDKTTQQMIENIAKIVAPLFSKGGQS